MINVKNIKIIKLSFLLNYENIKLYKIICVVIKSHENGSNDDGEFMHACIIIVFLLIKLHYSSIHLINCLFQFIQFYSVFANFINLTAMLSLIACCI